jgi:hypothetical protein
MQFVTLLAMNLSFGFRQLLAATVVLLLFAAAYEAAVRWPGKPPAAGLANAAAPPDSVAGGGQSAAVLPTTAQLGYHRYEGTVDGRPVLAEIRMWMKESADIDHALYPTLTGYYYDRATGVSGFLGEASWFRPDQTLETWHSEIVGDYYEKITVLCADQAPGGPLLTGWCRQPGQRRMVPVHLRERYTDGVRYEILSEESWEADSPDDAPATGRVSRDYIHLLGPDTLRPALARLQCPPHAARQRAVQKLLHRLIKRDEFTTDEEDLDVTLNEADLLACRVFQTRETGPRYYQQSRYHRLYDLRTGQQLRLADQLRPGGLQQLQRLLTRQAMADTAYARHRDHWRRGKLLALPTEGFELTPTTWTATYEEPNPENSFGYGRELSWADVRPLLRPTSPLQRLLRVRGL